jgi:hypothetical protein
MTTAGGEFAKRVPGTSDSSEKRSSEEEAGGAPFEEEVQVTSSRFPQKEFVDEGVEGEEQTTTKGESLIDFL